uniref:Uncharacterized protein n=1 Tax=Pipistrellus kuhlii TaxID=59472 RepID=A0A7J7VUL7_PIPKU|nr:hypothetical protein mPipKuh1_008247 [Pipistrellus kuhlii]
MRTPPGKGKLGSGEVIHSRRVPGRHTRPRPCRRRAGGGADTKALAPPSSTGPGDHSSGLRVAPARRPEAPGGQGLSGRVSLGQAERRPGPAGPSIPQEGWPGLSTLDPGKHPAWHLGTRQAPPGTRSTPLSWGTLPEPQAQEPRCRPAPPRVAAAPPCAEPRPA